MEFLKRPRLWPLFLTGDLFGRDVNFKIKMDAFFNQNKKIGNLRVRKNQKESIEPEEILLDAAKSPDLENQKIEVPLAPRTFKIFFAVILTGFLILSGQSFYMQIVKGSTYERLAEKNYTRTYPILASRGIIYDRDQKQLVYNIPSFDLVVSLPDLPRDQKERSLVIDKAAAIVGIPPAQITAQLSQIDLKNTQSISVAGNLEHDKILELEAKLPELTGFALEKNAVRQYLFSPYFSHILGYLGKLELDELKENQDYFMIESIGKEGLERSYERVLRGQPGQQLMEVDSQGKEKNLISETQPKSGENLILSVDRELQQTLYDSLSNTLKQLQLKKAAAVAMDPRSGAILAMVSLPSFDNNLFAQGISMQDYQNLENDPTKPFLNRTISGQYAPGSTIKPVIGAAALQEKIITPSTKINDSTGELVVPNQYNPQIVYRYPDWKAHGIVDIYSAIAQSCNVFFYTVGGGYGNIKGLGLENLTKYLKLFGFGEKLGIDLPGEESGLVPDEGWKQKVKNEPWYLGDTYHLSIGQGDLLVTPLEMAATTAVIANGGKLFRPKLVDKIVDSDKNIIETIQPEILRENFISEENLSVIRKAMRQTVTAGSALMLNSINVAVAAKTGTAQVAGQENSNAWATVFAPIENPQIVLAILVENAGEGSSVAIPIAKEVLEKYFK